MHVCGALYTCVSPPPVCSSRGTVIHPLPQRKDDRDFFIGYQWTSYVADVVCWHAGRVVVQLQDVSGTTNFRKSGGREAPAVWQPATAVIDRRPAAHRLAMLRHVMLRPETQTTWTIGCRGTAGTRDVCQRDTVLRHRRRSRHCRAVV